MVIQHRLPTMKDVAGRADVSIQTVSAVINNKPGIRQETRARVLAVIDELGYRPYSVARSLRTGQTHTIALFVPDIDNPSFSGIASAAEDHAHAWGYSLVVYNTHDDLERETNYIRTVAQRWIDGVLFVAAGDRMSGLDALAAAHVPAVAIDRIPEGYRGPSVTLDNAEAGCVATRHLLDLGHTRIAHISGPQHLRLARERQLGWHQTLKEHGLKPGPCAGGEGAWECASGYLAMRKILDCGAPPTAVFAASDRMAIGAMRALHEAGLDVPGDISVMGLDDIEVAAFQSPPLTTVRQSFAHLATLAVQLLLDILAGRIPDQFQIVLEPALVVRRSTAPPP
jgi:LacI family transcriptional regulator